MSLLAGSHARTSQWRESVVAWLAAILLSSLLKHRVLRWLYAGH
jgi:hypothetical protein